MKKLLKLLLISTTVLCPIYTSKTLGCELFTGTKEAGQNISILDLQRKTTTVLNGLAEIDKFLSTAPVTSDVDVPANDSLRGLAEKIAPLSDTLGAKGADQEAVIKQLQGVIKGLSDWYGATQPGLLANIAWLKSKSLLASPRVMEVVEGPYAYDEKVKAIAGVSDFLKDVNTFLNRLLGKEDRIQNDVLKKLIDTTKFGLDKAQVLSKRLGQTQAYIKQKVEATNSSILTISKDTTTMLQALADLDKDLALMPADASGDVVPDASLVSLAASLSVLAISPTETQSDKDKALEQLQAANIVLNTWLSGVDPILRIQVEWLAKNPPSSGGFGFMPSSPVVTPTEDPGVADQTKSLEGIASKLSVLDTPAMVLSDTVSAEQNDSIKLLVTAAQFTMQKMQDLSARLKYVPKYVQVQAGKFIETNGWLTQSFKSTQINGQDAFEQFVTIMSCRIDLMPTVSEMDFYAFPLDETSALVVAKLLPQFTGLTKFTYRNSLSLTAFQAILGGLKEVPTLQSFSIQGTQDTQPVIFTADHATALATALPQFSSLNTLRLYNTQLESGGLALIMPALAATQSLTTLQLGKSNLDDTAAPNIVQLIQKPGLSDLDLSWNALGDKGIIALVDALEPSRKKSSLVRLSLRENQITAASSGLIAGMFLAKAKPRDSFANLTAVGLSGNPIQYFDDVYPALNKGQKDTNVIFS